MSPDPAAPGLTTRSCLACGVEFTVDSATIRRVYCSRDCRRHAALDQQPVERTCIRCGGTFESLRTRPRRYCSTTCRTGARNDPAKAEERACVICGNTYQAHGTSRQVYCSPDCRRAAETARERARNEARAQRLGTATARASQRAAVPLAPARQPEPVPRPPARTSSGERDPLEPAATRNCPHCDQPITIVALLATPEAARPSTQGRIPDVVAIRRGP